MSKRRYNDPLVPISHHAPVRGRTFTFANVEYPTEKPPMEIKIDGMIWRRVDDERDEQ